MSDRDCINDLQEDVMGDVIVLNVIGSSKANRYSTLECPTISPVEEPVSNMNAWPNLFLILVLIQP
jgi:hypothetical protein